MVHEVIISQNDNQKPSITEEKIIKLNNFQSYTDKEKNEDKEDEGEKEKKSALHSESGKKVTTEISQKSLIVPLDINYNRNK